MAVPPNIPGQLVVIVRRPVYVQREKVEKEVAARGSEQVDGCTGRTYAELGIDPGPQSALCPACGAEPLAPHSEGCTLAR